MDQFINIMEWIYQHIFVAYEMYFRILLSAILGFAIGLDRTAKGKPAGIKTYTFVTVAAALLTIVSIEAVGVYSEMHPNTRTDPMRLAAQIVTGLGFIGAGVILKDGLRVKGLTSAAMILFAGGIGIGTAAGFYGIVIFTMVVTFILNRIGLWVEKKEPIEEKHQADLEDTNEID